MMNNNYKIPLLLLTALLLLEGCQKVSHIQGEGNPDSQIGYFNVSEYVKSQLQSASASCFLLVDTNDTTFTPDTTGNSRTNIDSVLYFQADIYQLPNTQFNSQLPLPWIEYVRLYQGTHTITLTDSGGHHPLITARVPTVNAIPTTIYFADNLGSFRYWALADTVTVATGMVALRIMDLSPDAGNVFLTIGGQPATGFPGILNYGQITSFIPWPDSAASPLNISFYQVGDSVDVLTGTTLNISLGHSYNIVLNGYMNNQSFPDPITGNMLSIGSDLNIKATQNN